MGTLAEKYSLAWLQIATITLLTIIGSLVNLLDRFQKQMTQSRARVETVCDAIRTTSEQIYQGPQLLVNASLKSIYTAKENILRAIHSGIMMLQKVIVWLIQTYKSTYRCLLLFVINSVMSILKFVLGPLQKAAESIASLVTGGPSGQLGDWTQILSGIQAKIDQWFKLDDQFVEGIVGKPFEALSGQLNATLGEWKPSLFQQERLSSMPTFECNPQAITHALDTIETSTRGIIMTVIEVLVALIVVFTLVNILYIRFRHRFSKESLGGKEEGKSSLEEYIWANYESSWIPWEKRHGFFYRLVRYMSHPMVVYCLLTGVYGLAITMATQWLMEQKTMGLYSDFDHQVDLWTIATTTQWKLHALDQFQAANQWIGETEADLNHIAFGVVKSTVFTLNDTLSAVVNQIQSSIDHVLGGTIFETPAKDVIQCLLLTKIENIESGLTWIYDHAYVNLTRIDLPFLQTNIFEPRIKTNIQKHLEFQNSPISLDHLQTFYYLLLSLWTLCLLIGICFQCYYIFYTKRKNVIK
ncbi:hypothetical protein K501DRAFT_292798 [Backusella circina FSU 941]|nr:hypothetical protein K501DRAFT_292798 [Backusella circina FSU 941]